MPDQAPATAACWRKVGYITEDAYCGEHGRAAGWPCQATAAHRVTPREAMEMARYGEPTDTYTWDLVVDRCLTHLAARGYKIVEATDGE